MSPSKIQAKVVAERIAWIRSMVKEIRALPLDSFEAFSSDPRNVVAAESYLRRGLEAILDLGRHMMAKGFGEPVIEYKEIARALERAEVVDAEKRNF